MSEGTAEAVRSCGDADAKSDAETALEALSRIVAEFVPPRPRLGDADAVASADVDRDESNDVVDTGVTVEDGEVEASTEDVADDVTVRFTIVPVAVMQPLPVAQDDEEDSCEASADAL